MGDTANLQARRTANDMSIAYVSVDMDAESKLWETLQVIFCTSDNNYIPPISFRILANDRFNERVPAFNINDKLGTASCLYQFKALKELGAPILEPRMKLYFP